MDLKEVARFSNQRRHPWELARLEIIDTGLKRIHSESGKEKLNVLDIGSGDMFVVMELAKRNPTLEFFAVDNHYTPEILAQFSAQIQGLPIRMFSSLENFSAENKGSADVITLFDVVEHIDDDEGFLKSLLVYGFVSPQTKLFITVPSYQALFCSHDVFLEHFRRHNCKSIRRVTENAGFVKLRFGYFFFSLILPRIFTVIKEKILGASKKPGTGLSEWKGGKFKTSFIKGILMLDYLTGAFLSNLGIRFPGLSTYIVCKASA